MRQKYKTQRKENRVCRILAHAVGWKQPLQYRTQHVFEISLGHGWQNLFRYPKVASNSCLSVTLPHPARRYGSFARAGTTSLDGSLSGKKIKARKNGQQLDLKDNPHLQTQSNSKVIHLRHTLKMSIGLMSWSNGMRRSQRYKRRR